MKTIAVLGANGMLGYAVSEYFARKGDRVIGIGRAEYDIARDPLSKLEGLLRGASDIVNCAGVIKPLIAGTPAEDVQIFSVDAARGIKVTIPRPIMQGDLEDSDSYGCQWFPPLIELEVPD